MENKKNGTRFVINFIDKTITGTKASFDKAGKGEGEIYIELADKMAAYPEYKLVIKEQKKRSTKTKQTYDGLNFDLMEKFSFLRYSAACVQTNRYALVRDWFIAQFPEFRKNPLFYLYNKPEIVRAADVIEMRGDAA